MKTKTMSARAMMLVALSLFALAGADAPAAAQQDREDCRCVDRDGNEIERCSCWQSPDVQNLIERYGVDARRPRLGLTVEAGQPASFDADGARVADVLRGGPADEAGLREGDVIVRLDGRLLTESIGARAERDFDLDRSAPVQRLLAIARDLDPGQEVEVEYIRDGETRSTTVVARALAGWGNDFSLARPTWNPERLRDEMRVLAEGLRDRARSLDGPDRDVRFHLRGLEEGRDLRVFGGRDGQVRILGGGDGFVLGGLYRHGIELVELNPGLGAYFGAEDGVLVVEVADDSELGLQAGDVILAVGDREASSPDRVRRILTSYAQDEEVTFRILRDGDETTVTGRIF